MVVVLDMSQLEILVDNLEPLTGSWKIQEEAKAKLEGKVSEFEFFVDAWPDFTSVFARSLQPGYHMGVYELYTRDSDNLSAMLRVPNLIDWTRRIEFLCMRTEIYSIVSQLIQEQGRSVYTFEPCLCLRVTAGTLNIRAVPEGFKLRSLDPDDSDLVNSAWKFFRNEESNTYIKSLITLYPSCSLTEPEGGVVGFCLTYHYNALGMLHVREDYRGRGLARVILSHLAHTCLQSKSEVYVFIEESNVSSIKTHKDVGFEVVHGIQGLWVRAV